MKNIFKYIFISFGLLFLVSFFFVEKTYAIEDCWCECGCNYSRGVVVSCKPCTCTNYCACGHSTGYPSCLCNTCPPPEPTICPVSVYNAMVAECRSLGYCGAVRDCSNCIECDCQCGTASDGGCNPVYDISACGAVGGDVCTGECRDPDLNPTHNCEFYDCPEGYTGVWEPSLESCICQRTPLTPDNPDCLYPCSDGTCCPAGTFCGDTVAGYTICVDPDSGGTGGGDSVYTCSESDTICSPTPYCEDNGWTTSTTPYFLEDIVSCTSRIECEDVPTYGDCYEDPSVNNNPDDPATGSLNDIQTLRVTMGNSVSNWIEQVVSENIFEKLINKVFAQTTYTTETNLGFSNDSASGLELNNPLPVEARYSDSDGVEDMEALYFWLSSEGTEPTKSPRYIDTIGDGSNAETESDSSFGFMVRRTGTTWVDADIYIPEITVSGNYWVKIGEIGENFFIYGPNGFAMVRISNPELSVPSSDDIILTFDMEFLNEYSGVEDYEQVYEGTYDVLTMVHDKFSFIPWDNYIYDDNAELNTLRASYFAENEIRDYDQWQDMGLTWTVDLTPPEAEIVRVTVTDDNELGIYWKVNDGQTNLSYVVGNVYRDITSGGTLDSVEYLGPDTGKSYEIPVFSEDILGSLDESSLWKIDYTSTSSTEDERTESVDIQGNVGGLIDFYVTVFDSAGNTDTLSDSFSLASWIITKGGLVYSTEGTNIAIRLLDFSEGGGWASDLWYSPDRDEYPNIEVFDPDLADLSSEVLSGNVDYDEDLYELPHSVEINGVHNLSVKVLQEVGMLRNSLYQTYKERAESQITAIGAETVSVLDNMTFTGKASDYCDGAYCIVNTTYNLTLDSGFLCDTKMLFLTSGNITIRPDLMNEHNTDGCIFVAGGNIVIEEGTYASEGSTTPRYDIVEGYMLADGIIYIEAGDAGLSVKDGLQVNGGLIAFGGTQSIVVARTMKLKDMSVYPALAVHAASGYGKIALKFFGAERSVYKQEVGYKPF